MSDRTATERIHFGKIKEAIEPPNLIEVQLNSYVEFLQKDVSPSKRKNIGLQAVFKEVFPIESYDEKVDLDFASYDIGEPKMTALECQREGQTFSAPLHVTFQLKDEKGTKEEKVYMGEIPLMTPRRHLRHQRRRARRRQPVASLAGHRLRIDHSPQRQGALQLPHHSGSRLVARSAVRHERPALHLSRSPQTPPKIPRHHLPARDRLRRATTISSSSSTTSKTSS